MRIVDRATFLALPEGTIFAKFGGPNGQPEGASDLCPGEVCIKGETVVGVDFVVQELFPWFEGCDDSGAYFDALIAMLRGEPSPPLDYNCGARDGLFDKAQLFAVWDADDAARLLARLQEAFAAAYGDRPRPGPRESSQPLS